MDISRERLADLLVDPHESLDCEIKNWLNLKDSNDDKATFAKAVLALANHGGGFVVLGLIEGDAGFLEAEGRPATLNMYNQDAINGIMQGYCDPHFHCSVHHVTSPADAIFPVVVVPGGHKVPIRAKRSGPNGNTVHDNAIYIRKPGPRSEIPQKSQEWDELLARCLRNRRDEMFDQIRDLITGAVPLIEQPVSPAPLDEWMRASRQRWIELSGTLPAGVGPQFIRGRYSIAYEISGERRQVSTARFPEVLKTSVVRHTGWPPFWYPTRPEITPYLIEGAVECWLGGDSKTPPEERDAAHSDFWRIHPDGLAYLIRGYQEDDTPAQRQEQVTRTSVFDINLPVWRVGEALLHARSLAANLFERPTTIRFNATYEGLAGRSLVSVNNRRHIWENRVARQDEITLSTCIEAQAVDSNLPEILHPLLSPLYALFDFFELPMGLVVEELARMKSGNL